MKDTKLDKLALKESYPDPQLYDTITQANKATIKWVFGWGIFWMIVWNIIKLLLIGGICFFLYSTYNSSVNSIKESMKEEIKVQIEENLTQEMQEELKTSIQESISSTLSQESNDTTVLAPDAEARDINGNIVE